MKKILITGIVLLFALFANAQQTGTRYNDTVAPPPPEINRVNKAEGIKMRSKSEIEAEKEAKDKGSNKNQTQVNPDRIVPIITDTIQQPRPKRR